MSAAHAQDATWGSAPATGDFNTANNWAPATVPTGTASFSSSTRTTLTFSGFDTAINAFQFNAGAPAYTFNLGGNELDFNGAGVVNNSSNAPTISTGSGGLITFNNSSTAANAKVTVGTFGEVDFNNQSTAGSAIITSSLGFIFFNDNTTAGHSTISNSGSITFSNSSTAGSAAITTQAGGFLLSFADSSSAGNATITTNAGSQVQFTDSATGGTARIITKAGGNFDISGLTSGGMIVGSIEGAGAYNLGANTLTVGGNNLSTIVSGVISDCASCTFGGTGGSLVKVGIGTLILSGLNTYTGSTTIDGGTLEVNGSITDPTINAGGVLAGTGTVGATQVNAGGTLAPGPVGGVGTLTIAGTLAFQSGAIYLTTISGAAASSVNVTGTASLAGTVQGALASKPTAGSYDILHSAGLGGTSFSNVVVPNYSATLSYTTTDVFLNIAGVALGNSSGLNQNQQAVANALSSFVNNGGTLPAPFANLINLTGASLGGALTQLDGEAATGAEHTAFELMTEFLGLLLDPFVDGRFGGGASSGSQAIGFAPDEDQFLPPDVALAYASILNRASPAPFVQRWTAWGASYGGGQFTNGNSTVGSSNLSSQIFGFAGGMDYHYSPDTIVGVAVGGAGLNWGLAGGLGGGRSDSFQTGVYGITRFGPAYLAASLAFGDHWMTTNRSSLGDQLTGSFNAQSYGARFEGGYRYAVLPNFGVTPYAALQPQVFHTPGYSETDVTGGGLGLTYASMSATDVRTELGARLDSPTVIAGVPVILRGRLAWAHDFVGNPALGAVFQALPATNFVVNGAPIPNDSALASAGAEIYLTPRLTLLAKFDSEFAPGAQTYGGSGTLRYIW